MQVFAGTLALVMRWCAQPGEPLFGSGRGCDDFEQRLLDFDGASAAHATDDADEVLYVLSGSGTAAIGGETITLKPSSAAWIAQKTP